jgi:hypothetical protein
MIAGMVVGITAEDIEDLRPKSYAATTGATAPGSQTQT